MSSPALPKLRHRREYLQQRIAQQRLEFSTQIQEVSQSLSFVQQGYSIVEQMKQHRLALLGLTALVFIVRPKRIFASLKTGLRIWAVWKTIVK